ncbi:type II toxin-antitoxin system VapB15 family antitoxin [Parabacteroides sp.]
MNTAAFNIELSYNQILDLVRQLPVREKKKLTEELFRESVSSELSYFLNKFKTDDLTDEDILAEVEAVRSERYS